MIYITGYGIISAIGNNKAEVLSSLKEGRSGIACMRHLRSNLSHLPVAEVALTDAQMRAALGVADDFCTSRTGLMGIYALKEALEQAELTPELLKRMPLISGTTVGGMEKSEAHYGDFFANNLYDSYIATHDCGSTTEMMADYFDAFSSLTTLSTACSSAANAIIRGAEMIKGGECEMAAVGGSECLSLFHLNGFNSLMILDEKPCRPFDRMRAGLNLGEGAAFLILESEESVRKRGIKPLAILSGYANRCDAFHQTATSPDGEGAYLSMSAAIRAAGLEPRMIDYVNAHGTATPNNDVCESAALRRVFGTEIPPVSSTKSFTGHTTSASGSIEAAICLLAMEHDFIPANLNWSESDDNCIIPYTAQGEKCRLKHILCNSFAFGGNDSSLIFTRTDNYGGQEDE